MGEHKLSAVKAVAAACQEAVKTMVEAPDEAMRVQTPGGVTFGQPALRRDVRSLV